MQIIKNMKTLLIILTLLISSAAFSKESCTKEALNLNNESNKAEILYYTGTCHYRNEEYDLSAKLWEQLAEIKNIEEEQKHLQINVLNNLGYLMFYGLGIEKNQIKAISFWEKAITMGQTESEYHLCHAYADEKESTYNKEKAKLHCNKALLIYRGMVPRDEEILSLIENYYDQVK